MTDKAHQCFTGWRKDLGPRLWRIALQQGEENIPRMPHNATLDILAAYSAYNLPIFLALIQYFHTAAGYPVYSIWLKSISAGNYSSWPGLTLANATNYYPSTTATIMGHLFQKIQGVRSTRPKLPTTSSPNKQIPRVPSDELFIQVTPISKLYNDDTGRFPVHARSGNQYIIIAYHCDANLILT